MLSSEYQLETNISKLSEEDMIFELPHQRTKPAPFAVMAPLAEQAYDLIKHDRHFTLLGLCPQDWDLL